MILEGVCTLFPGITSNPLSGFTGLVSIFQKDVTFTPGTVTALVANAKTVTVTGLLTTDQVLVNVISGSMLGANIATSRVSAADTLEITFTTAVAIGLSLGSFTFRVTVFR